MPAAGDLVDPESAYDVLLDYYAACHLQLFTGYVACENAALVALHR